MLALDCDLLAKFHLYQYIMAKHYTHIYQFKRSRFFFKEMQYTTHLPIYKKNKNFQICK